MQSRNNLSGWFQVNLYPSDLIRQIFSWLWTSVFSLESKRSISDNVLPIALQQICYGQILIPTYHGTFKALYQDIYIYPYLNIYRSPYVHIYVPIYLDIIHSFLRIYGYIAHYLSSHPIDHISNGLLGLPTRPSTDPTMILSCTHPPFFRGRRNVISRLPSWRSGAGYRLSTVAFPSHCP